LDPPMKSIPRFGSWRCEVCGEETSEDEELVSLKI
jgi:formylmethanofuran dehydrogenase subunit E